MANVGYLQGMKFGDILFLTCTVLCFVIINKTLQSHARIPITKIHDWTVWDNYRFVVFFKDLMKK